MKMEKFLLLIMVTFASDRKENDADNLILVKIEEDEYTKQHKKTSQYIGVSYNTDKTASWQASRHSKNEKKTVYNGTYKDEEIAAHASDTLARKLMKNGEQNHKLNFPDDNTEVYHEKQKETASSIYYGVSYQKHDKLWSVRRHSKHEKKVIYFGSYKNEETAAHASDTLARKLIKNGEQNLKLNFPDDDTEVHPEEQTTSSNYIGVNYIEKYSMWRAARWSKKEKKLVYNGTYKAEEQAAHASDTLTRKLMKNGEQNYKLNFPDDDTEMYSEKKTSEYVGVSYCETKAKWVAYRRSKKEKKNVYNGSYKDEEQAAHASDTLANKLMENGEQNHKLNFPDDDTECQTNKRKRSDHEDLENSQNK